MLTAILAFISAIYVYLNQRMAKASEVSAEAMRAQSEASLRPYVTVLTFVRPHTPFLYLRYSRRLVADGAKARRPSPYSSTVFCLRPRRRRRFASVSSPYLERQGLHSCPLHRVSVFANIEIWRLKSGTSMSVCSQRMSLGPSISWRTTLVW